MEMNETSADSCSQFENKFMTNPPAVRPPIQTADPLLPIAEGEFTWQQFETFCEDYVRVLARTDKVYRYGTRGQKQKGIDFFADEAGGRTTYQCRQWAKFTVKDAKKAVAETTYEGAVRHVLLVTCEVGKDVRDVIDAQPGWEIRDIRNISSDVSISIPLGAAKRLLDKHFGAPWRRNFLGVSGLSTFVDAEVFFGPQLTAGDLLSHTTELIGRDAALSALAAFQRSETQRVMILSGRGGIGKSRLLAAFADVHTSDSVRFVERGVTPTPHAADELPMGTVTLVVDDAHQREDLSILFALQRQRQAMTKLLVVTRSHSVERLRGIISDAAVDPSRIAENVALTELSRAETAQLVRAILPDASQEAVDLIVSTAKDSPLVAAVASRLLLRRELDLGALSRDEDFRQVVLRRFRDEVLGTVTSYPAPLVQKFILAASAIGPFKGKQHDVGTALAQHLGISADEYLKLVDATEVAGLLLRRGYTYRVTPDVLADFILEDGCLMSDGSPTGFAEAIFREFGGAAGAQVLRNLGEIDWRSTRAGSQTATVARIFEALQQDFARGTILERTHILDTLSEVAPYQPTEVLGIVEQALAQPVGEISEWEVAWKFSDETVLRRVPEILRRVAFNLDFVGGAADLLWQLGRDKPARLNSATDHPVRILQDLAGFDVQKPMEYREALLDRVERWVKEPGAFDHVHSPLDVIDPMLARQGIHANSAGFAVSLQPYFVNREATKTLRARAVAVIDRAAADSLRAVFRSIASYASLFHDFRTAPFGQPMPQDYDENWREERVRAVDALGSLAPSASEPLVHLEIFRVVQWYARHEPDEPVRDAAARVLEALPTSPEHDLTEMLVDPHGWRYRDDELMEAIGRETADPLTERRMDVARHVIATLSPEEFVKRAGDRLRLAVEHGLAPTPQIFFAAIVSGDTTYAGATIREVIKDPGSVVAEYLHGFLIQMTQADRGMARTLISEMAASGNPRLTRAAAMSYVFNHDLDEGERAALTAMLQSADEPTVIAAIDALVRIKEANEAYVLAELQRLEIAGSLAKAHALGQMFRRHEDLLAKVDDATVRRLVGACSELLTLEDYDVSWFLGHAAERMPDAVVRLLLRRIEKSHDGIEGYRGMPFHRIPINREALATQAGYEDLLREVRDQLQPATWQRHHHVPALFRSIARLDDKVTLRVLREWVDSGEPEKIEDAAQLLSAASAAFVFEQRDVVVHILERAHAAGKDCFDHVRSALAKPNHSQMRTGSGGEAFPQDVALKERAAAAAAALTPGTPGERFYRDLASYAAGEIRDKQLRDEEDFVEV
jgi:hypothetical protein